LEILLFRRLFQFYRSGFSWQAELICHEYKTGWSANHVLRHSESDTQVFSKRVPKLCRKHSERH
jgi:hypothetical protein